MLLKFVPAPEADPDAPSMLMFGTRGRFESALKEAGYTAVKEEHRSVPATWPGSPEDYWQNFTEIAAPFKPLLAQLPPARRDDVRFDVIAGLRKYVKDGSVSFPLEIVLASAAK